MDSVLALMVLTFLVIVFASLSLRILRPYEKGLVERLGRYVKTLDSGLNIIIPFVENIRKVDIRERVIDVPPQEVITKDNVVVTVDAIVYFEITDPVRVVYQVENFMLAAMKLAQTNLRNVVGDMELDQTLTSREKINVQLREILDDATDKWGVRVTRVEIQKIDPPRDITDAMSQQMKAERTKRALILEAEGVRQSQILRAEGEKQSAILAAQGKAEAIRQVADADRYQKLTVAQGEGEAITTVFAAIHQGDPTHDLLAVKYLEALPKIADGKATKLFLPIEASGVLSALGGMVEVFRQDKCGESDPPA
ncbi:MAG: SPFH/Band 7/PHB domain protein [Armatimonadetes bacterium]|nr:SPFH/Band 7/PHB domain protein [Armatimonadota bacterium]